MGALAFVCAQKTRFPGGPPPATARHAATVQQTAYRPERASAEMNYIHQMRSLQEIWMPMMCIFWVMGLA